MIGYHESNDTLMKPEVSNSKSITNGTEVEARTQRSQEPHVSEGE